MPANETRLAGAALLSLAAHVVLLSAVLTWLARPPVYRTPPDETPPWVVRLVPPPPPAATTPRTSARRPVMRVLTRPASERDEATALVTVGEPGEIATGPVGPDVSTGDGGDGATPEKVRRALRGGMVGCANADRVGLNLQERTHCVEVLGKDIGAIQRAMREGEQNRLSLGGRPPKDYNLFRDACRAYSQGSGQQPRAPAGPC